MIRNATRFARLVPFVAGLAALHLPARALAQDLLSAADVVAMESPEPDARIPYGEAELQFGNLRLPEGSGPHPVIVFIHGGCWLSLFGIAHVGQTEQALADAGYAVWSLEYRRVGDEGGGWPGTFLDVAGGIDHLRELAREYPLDLGRVIASGHSAGGQLALWAAARPGIPASSELYAADPLPIQGVLALAPAADLESLHGAGVCGDVVDKLMGGSPDAQPAHYDAGSPMRLVPVDVPQRLVIGAHDRSWAPGGRAYFERARAAGSSPVSLREAPESGHFEMIVPTTSSWPVVTEELEALTREMAAHTSNPRFGVWRLRSDAPPPAINIMTYEPYGDGGMSIIVESTNPQGRKSKWGYVTMFEGAFRPVTGQEGAETAVEIVDERTTRISNKRDGRVYQVILNVLSEDGNTITNEYVRLDESGDIVRISHAVYERVR